MGGWMGGWVDGWGAPLGLSQLTLCLVASLDRWCLQAAKMESPTKPSKAASALWGAGGHGNPQRGATKAAGDWSHCVWSSVGTVVASASNPEEKGIILTQKPLVVISGGWAGGGAWALLLVL